MAESKSQASRNRRRKFGVRDAFVGILAATALIAPFIDSLIPVATARIAKRDLLVSPINVATVYGSRPGGVLAVRAHLRTSAPVNHAGSEHGLSSLRSLTIDTAPVLSPYILAQTAAQAPRPQPQSNAPSKTAALSPNEPKSATAPAGAPLPPLAPAAEPVRPHGLSAYSNASPPTDPNAPRIAFVVTALGIDQGQTLSTIADLPSEIALAFAPIGSDVALFEREARDDGHVTLVETPMEPMSYPRTNPGPLTLLTSSTPDENLQRIDSALATAPGVSGISSYLGARFTADDAAFRVAAQHWRDLDLFYFDNQPESRSRAAAIAEQVGLRYARSDVAVDANRTLPSIRKELAQLEKLAKIKGSAIGVGAAYPVTVSALRAWIPTLAAKGIRLVPILKMVDPKMTAAQG